MTIKPIIACRPVIIPDEIRVQCAMNGIVSNVPTYANSTEIDCESCGTRCYIGPRQRELLKSDAASRILCFMCSVKFGSVVVANLGNDQRHPADRN